MSGWGRILLCRGDAAEPSISATGGAVVIAPDDPVAVAGEVARQHGLPVETPVPLRSTNNVVAWLRPSRVVAKIGAGHRRRLERELAVAAYLVEQGAPVIAPAPELPTRIHSRRGYDMSFWTYVPQENTLEPNATEIATALHRLHQTLQGLTVETCACTEELEELRAGLEDSNFARSMSAEDRGVLIEVLSTMAPELSEANVAYRVVHGAPHRNNVLMVDREPRFIDFETVCRGPVEWDLAHLEPEVARRYPGNVNDALLATCRFLVSAKTAGWCYHDVDRGPDMRWHAEHHMQIVRRMVSGGKSRAAKA